MKKVLLLCLVVILTISSMGCGFIDRLTLMPRKYKKDGLTISLPGVFKENTEVEASWGYNSCYESNNIVIYTIKDSFSEKKRLEELTIDDYASLIYKANYSKDLNGIVKIDGLTTIEYEDIMKESNVTYISFVTLFKGKDAFWIVQFMCPKEMYDTYKPDFIKWAKTVKV